MKAKRIRLYDWFKTSNFKNQNPRNHFWDHCLNPLIKLGAALLSVKGYITTPEAIFPLSSSIYTSDCRRNRTDPQSETWLPFLCEYRMQSTPSGAGLWCKLKLRLTPVNSAPGASPPSPFAFYSLAEVVVCQLGRISSVSFIFFGENRAFYSLFV